MKKRILITYASYGSGHKTTAEYIYDYFKEHGNYEIKIISPFTFQSKICIFQQKVILFQL